MKINHRRSQVCATLAVGLTLLLGCSKPKDASTRPAAAEPAAELFPIVVQLDWIPEPEHGGFFQAEARGYFREAGLKVTLLPGGPNAFVMQKLATNQANIGQSDSTSTLLGMSEGLPLIHVGAVFQNDPSVLMLHAENPVNRFEDLNGKTIMARPEWAFLPYLKRKYGIEFAIIPQNFSVANFISDKNFIQQGFYIAEPYHILKGGAKQPKFLYVWDAGFDAYTVLSANRPWAAKHPKEVRAFLQAYIRGWQDYIEGDPAPAHALMKQANPNNTDEFMAFSRQMIIAEHLVTGRVNPSASQIGRISRERFATQLKQLEELAIIPRGKLTVDQVMTTEYLP